MILYEILDKDIERCDEAIKSKSGKCLFDLYNLLYPKYLKIVDGINLGVQETEDASDLDGNLKNIQYIKEKLELFKGLQEEHLEAEKLKSQQISVSNHNVNTNEVTIDISFNDIRDQINDMSALPKGEIDEILKKIELLEKIVESSDRKSQKWENAKDIIKWVADKGADVGIALLPLILKIQ